MADRNSEDGAAGSDPNVSDSDPPTDADEFDIDSAALEIIRNACGAIAEEMNATLVRTGYSPNIKERQDCSSALFDADGEMISQAETMPVHLGAMPFSVAAAIDRFPPATLEPGDAILLNDPFRGGAHLPDLTLVTPVFVDSEVPNASDHTSGERKRGASDASASDRRAGEARESGQPRDREVVAYAANRAHHADIGGARAGSVAADSTEIYQEGLRIPPVKLYEGGEVNETAMAMILANVRTPDERRGDLRAQDAANEIGERRFEDLVGKYGNEYLTMALEAIKDYSERRMRAELDGLSDGSYRFEDVLDDDGRGNEDLPVVATVTIEGDSVVVDFDGTAAQTAGPINAVFAVTASATYYALRCVTDPDIPPNHGCYRPIEIRAPEGSIVNPDPPAAVVGGNLETSQRVTDVVLGALAATGPERVLAGCQGTMNNLTFGGTDPRDDSPYAFYETQGGGFGGRAGLDGMDGVHVHMSNTMNTPIEVLETAYPLCVLRYELRADSGGAGEYRGGLGLRRDIGVRDHCATFSLLADRHRHAPYGLTGGADGSPGAAYRVPDGLEDIDTYTDASTVTADDLDGERLPGKVVRELAPGTVVSVYTPGAGGYGDPEDRDLEAVRHDVELGKISLETARERYGLSGIDSDATRSTGAGAGSTESM